MNVNYDRAWIRAVDWFANHNVTIEKVEKESGLLTARYSIAADLRFIDCGQISTSGFLGEPRINRQGILNVTVREVDSAKSRINVNFFGAYTLRGSDSWDRRLAEREGRCVSTGELEKSILNYIES